MKSVIKKYIDLGFDIIPCKLDKSPLIAKTWKEKFTLQEFDKAQAIGIKCGEVNNNLECIDIDNHNGTAKQNLTEFIEQIKDLYQKHNFPIEKTQGGGYHFIYRCEVIQGNQKLASVPKLNEQQKWVPDAIFETRGEGGYFLAYPSPGYDIIKNDIFKIPTISKEERSYILSVCKSFNTWSKPIESEFETGDKPGDLYNKSSDSLYEMKSILEKAGWKEKSKYFWTRPGKKQGISATLGKVAENIFYVWTSNGYPFEPEKAYTPFQVKALIEYNGNFKECAKDLAKKFDLKPIKKQPQEVRQIEPNKLHELLSKSLIDTDIHLEKPPVIMYIIDQDGYNLNYKRLFTLSNFSAIIGKAKSRKTTLMSMIASGLAKDGILFNKFKNNLPENKRNVIYFDTEQGDYDALNNMRRIERLAGNNSNNINGFCLREYSPLERCEIIEYAISFCQNLGVVIIDGIADLAKAINDEEEATRVVGLLLRWTKQYNIHISTILHQNKNDNFATGHLGSSVMKKAEIVISATKDKGSDKETIVSCDYSRGIDFADFAFGINENFDPELISKIVCEDNVNAKWYD
jgi:hypothetical protein